MPEGSKIAVLGMDRGELAGLMDQAGEPSYRAMQLLEAVYRQRVESLEEISTLPKHLRVRLAEMGVTVGLPRIDKKFVSEDGTVRYLMGFADGQSVETVWMPEGDGGEAGDGSEAVKLQPGMAEDLESRDDLRFEPGRVRGRLPVLSDGSARG